MKDFLNRIFKLEENKTTIKTEIIGGLTTFFAMCYIVIVNPNQIIGFQSDIDGTAQIWNACFVGGIISSVIATLCMAFIANKPFALAAGMGLNSFFFISFILPCIISGDNVLNGYGAGLAIILISGIIFFILSITGLRKYITTSLPDCLKSALPAGIGLFIAFVGLQNCGLIVNNEYVLVGIADFTKWDTAAPALIGIIGLVIIVVLSKLKIKYLSGASIIIGIIVSAGLYYIFGLNKGNSITATSLNEVFSDFIKYGLFNLRFDIAFDGQTIGTIFSAIMLIITFCVVDMFDTLGTLYGASAEGGMLDENGNPQNLQQEMLCDAIGTVCGALTGTSTIATYVESSAGIAAGARTGLASVITALLFIVCLFLAPIAQYIPTVAAAPALIFVGILLCKSILKVDFTDLASATPAFLTFIMMPLTYSISNGIMIGAIAYTVITLCSGKYAKKDIAITIVAIIAILRFIFIAL